MGLLDEAIRDHLELKRRRGADPGEIAREEREALEPVFPDEPRPAALDEEPQAAPLLDEEAPQGDPLGAEAASSHPVASISEETAELDMEAVLAQDERLAADAQAPHPAPGVQPEAGVEDELLDWEMPDRSTEPPPEPLPGQERLTFE